jgi:hypothetical protein
VSLTQRSLHHDALELKLELFCKLRENKRLPVAIPLKVNFLSSGRTAHVCTLDVSSTGARLHSAGHQFLPGDVIVVQRRIERAQARVVWVGDAESANGQVGIECPELEKFFWRERRTPAGRHSALHFGR